MSLDSHVLTYEDNRIIPTSLTPEEAHAQEAPHCHVGAVFLRGEFQKKALEVLLQKRSSAKDQFGGYWCMSASGHCLGRDFLTSSQRYSSGDGQKADFAAMERECLEETGARLIFNTRLQAEFLSTSVGNVQNVTTQKILRFLPLPETPAISHIHPYPEKPVCTLGYFHLSDGLFTPDPSEEVARFSWEPMQEVVHACRSGEGRNVTPWLNYALRLQFDHVNRH